MDKNHSKIHREVKYTKDAINNRNVIYGKMPVSKSARKVTFYEKDENSYGYDVGYDIRPSRTGPEDDSKKKEISSSQLGSQKSQFATSVKSGTFSTRLSKQHQQSKCNNSSPASPSHTREKSN